ncbi:hypothetical protein Halha_1673 [Halobacteroides halobius DSM 5150]|uniref:Uncharacterized protein n=1 Tax=Halobacteroides halobius (strain ATCC 35273 / DSM 5150 / MD-1) TaxID=748449 RepID=L0KAN7_HALHC|nr:hypothetical protein Halha_1673 [Halobacteroides halobius DSM 5150]
MIGSFSASATLIPPLDDIDIKELSGALSIGNNFGIDVVKKKKKEALNNSTEDKSPKVNIRYTKD